MRIPLIFPHSVTAQVRADYDRVWKIPLTNERMDDPRRTIHEEAFREEERSIQAFKVKASGLPLGNHFHRNRTELFFLLSGKINSLVTAFGVDKTDRRVATDLAPGTMILMPPNVAHQFVLAPESEMICYATGLFDPNDMIKAELD